MGCIFPVLAILLAPKRPKANSRSSVFLKKFLPKAPIAKERSRGIPTANRVHDYQKRGFPRVEVQPTENTRQRVWENHLQENSWKEGPERGEVKLPTFHPASMVAQLQSRKDASAGQKEAGNNNKLK